MAVDTATLTVAAIPARIGHCDLCTAGPTSLSAAALVRHSRGGAIQLAACDHCERALRRLSAAIGSALMVAERPVVEAVVARPAPVPAAAVHGEPQVVAEITHEVFSADGARWLVRVIGEPRGDGTWLGWLEFVGPRSILRTGQETSQPDRGALVYWAGGLTPAYLEGAFARAR
jgi:hypothetical protein